MLLKVVNLPQKAQALTNRVYVDKKNFSSFTNRLCRVVRKDRSLLFYVDIEPSFPEGSIGFNVIQRSWITVTIGSECQVEPVSDKISGVDEIIWNVDYYGNKQADIQECEIFDTNEASKALELQFKNYPVTLDQTFVLNFMVGKNRIMSFKAEKLHSYKTRSATGPIEMEFGIITDTSIHKFKKSMKSNFKLTGSNKVVTQTQLFRTNWDFTNFGVGGLDMEFSHIFRRAFASRVCSPELVQQLVVKHVKGILLYGPPGTGKTLMARQIGKMLNSKEPKIVNGPEILNKYVGESEANIRRLFADAEDDQNKLGFESPLHIIIFDEIDAICGQRGSGKDSSGVRDTVVNQLLSKMDGVNQLDNVLVIGMTNRKDLIDDALLRPGRFEIQIKIGLPDQEGRRQILEIHTRNLRVNKKLADDVNLDILAHKTVNFSGAELEGLVRAATTTAMNNLIQISEKVRMDNDAEEKLLITKSHFEYALENDIKPAFGISEDEFTPRIRRGIVLWCEMIDLIQEDGKLLMEQAKSCSLTTPISMLISGSIGCGKTALAVNIALTSKYPMLKFVSAEKMIGLSELSKCSLLQTIFNDASQSDLCCLVIDDIERIIGYVPLGQIFSNSVLQTLMILLNRPLVENKKLCVIATTNCKEVLKFMGLAEMFTKIHEVPHICEYQEFLKVIENYNFFDHSQIKWIEEEITENQIILKIPIKKLISICEMSLQAEEFPERKLVSLLLEDECLVKIKDKSK